MAITIKDIARELGVSPATVSLALNNSPMIGAATTRKVKEAAFSMGYVRNQHSRSSGRNRTGTIALVVPDIENSYYASMVQCVTIEAKAAGYDLYISMSQESLRDEWRILRRMAQQRSEAIIISPVNEELTAPDYCEWLNECATPLVFLGARHPGVSAPCIMCDLAQGMEELTTHVIASGAKRIVLATCECTVETLEMRMEGYLRAMKRAGRTGEIWRLKSMDYDEVYQRVISEPNLPDAIISMNDVMAAATINALTARGARVPDDVKVAGFDDSLLAQVSLVPITTVRQDMPALAHTAVSTALTMINGDARVQSQYQPCALVLRRSTGK